MLALLGEKPKVGGAEHGNKQDDVKLDNYDNARQQASHVSPCNILPEEENKKHNDWTQRNMGGGVLPVSALGSSHRQKSLSRRMHAALVIVVGDTGRGIASSLVVINWPKRA